MYAKVEKSKENKSRAVANPVAQTKDDTKQRVGFVDNRSNKVGQDFTDNRNPLVVQAIGWESLGMFNPRRHLYTFLGGYTQEQMRQNGLVQDENPPQIELPQRNDRLEEEEEVAQQDENDEEMIEETKPVYREQMTRNIFIERFVKPSYRKGANGELINSLNKDIKKANFWNIQNIFNVEDVMKEAWQDGRNQYVNEQCQEAYKLGKERARITSLLRTLSHLNREEKTKVHTAWNNGQNEAQGEGVSVQEEVNLNEDMAHEVLMTVELIWECNERKKSKALQYNRLKERLENPNNYNQSTGKPRFNASHYDDTKKAQWKLQADAAEVGSGSVDRLHLNVNINGSKIEVTIIDLTIGTH